MSEQHLKSDIQAILKEIFAPLIVGKSAEELDSHANIFQMGLESIAFVEIAGAIKAKLGVNISLRSMLENNSTINDLSEYIAEKMPEATRLSWARTKPESLSLEKQEKPSKNGGAASRALAKQISEPLTSHGPLTSQTAIERVVSQQLQLMSKHLELLRNGSSGNTPTQARLPSQPSSNKQKSLQKQSLELETGRPESIKLSPKTEKSEGAGLVEAPDFIPNPAFIATRLQPEVQELVVENKKLHHYITQLVPQLEQVSLTFIIQALRNLGWSYQVGESISLATVAQRLGVVPQHQRLLVRLLQILSSEGILKPHQGQWQVLQPLPTCDDPALQNSPALQQLPEWQLLYRCGSQLSSVLRGAVDPVKLMFPAWDTSTATQLYQDSPRAQVFNKLVQQVVTTAVAGAPQQRELRILEIGAGTGGTTSYLLPHLPEDRTQYCFTDVGDLFTALAQERFGDYRFVEYQALDIEQDPSLQGFEPHCQDVVIAANVLHATQNMRQTLANVRQLLAPGGVLVLLEGTHRQRWVDLTFGLLKGWWRFADVDLRSDHPLIDKRQWLQLLQESGFSSVAILPDVEADDNLGQVVILAQVSGSSSSKLVSKQGTKKSEGAGFTVQQQQHLDGLIARVVQRTQESKQLTQAARKVLANPRAAKWFDSSIKEMIYPLHIQRGAGARIWDVDGNEYIDLTMGFGPLLFGHSPPFVIEAIQEHIQRGLQNGPQPHLISKVAELMCELTGQERVCFCNSGTEAVMGAIRIARATTGRTKIAFFANSYHGHSDELLVGKIDNQDGTSRTIPAFLGVPKHKAEQVIMLDYGNPKSLDIIKAHAHELAAVLVEPVQSRKPDLQPREFLHQLRELTLSTGVALIIDEVITGFRMHPGGIQALWGIKADITAYGKALGAGLPIGAVAGKASFMDALDGGFWSYGDQSSPSPDVTFFAGTFFKNPLVMSVVWAVLNHIKDQGPQLQAELTKKTTKLANHLNDYFREKQLPIQVVHFGSLFRFTYPEHLWMNLLFYHLLERGIYVAEVRNLLLSTAHTDEDIEQIIRAVKASIEDMQAGGFLPSSPSKLSKPSDEDKKEVQLPLTEPQKAVWMASKIAEGASKAYNESMVIHLRGQLNLEVMGKAVRELVNRHEALRSTFSPTGDYQRIAPSGGLDIPLVDFSGLDNDLRDPEVSQFLVQEAGKTFDFEVGPLFRPLVVKLSEEHHILVLTFHHLVVDGWSMEILFRELGVIYSAQCQGVSYDLPEPMQYSKYVRRIEARRQSPEMASAEAYWLQQFADSVPVLDLPTDRQRPLVNRYRGDRKTLKLGKSLCDRLKSLSGQCQCTLFTTLLAGFILLLHRLSDQNDIVVGIPTAGQLSAGCEYMVGHCADLLPLRVKVGSDPKFKDYASTVKKVFLNGYDHQIYPFIDLSQKLQLPRVLSRTTLIGTTFNLNKISADPEFWGLEVELAPNHGKGAKFDLVFDIFQTNSELIVMCDYNSDLFDSQTIRLWLGHFQTLLLGAAANPEAPLSQLPLSTEPEGRELLKEWNDAYADYAQDMSIHQLFEHQDKRTPEANGGYVPLDPDYPSNPIGNILEDSQAEMLLTQEPLATKLNTPEQEILQAIWCEVLGLESVSLHEDFFEIGGHSLRATQAIFRIRKVFSVELQLSALFEARTIAQLSDRIAAMRRAPAEVLPQIFPVSREGDVPLSFAQGRLWFLNNFAPGNPAYNIPIAYRIEGFLNEEILANALNTIVERQESLRTSFPVVNGYPVQRIETSVEVGLNIIDLTGMGDSETQTKIVEIAKTEYLWHFDLNNGPLFRFTLVRLTDEERIFFVNLHHIIADGWSIGVFNRELGQYYHAATTAEALHLPELPIRYTDFTVGQQAWLQGKVRESQLAYWKDQLAGLVPLQLPKDYPRPAVQSFVGKAVQFGLKPEITTSLQRLSRDHGVTLFMTLVAAFFLLLYRYSGQEDLAIATPIANRNRREIEHLIGFFVNTLILRCHVSGDMTLTDLLQQVRQVSLSAYARQDFPFEQVVEALAPERDSSQNPLVQVIFALQNAPMEPPILPGLNVALETFEEYTARFDLEIHLFQVEDGLTGYIVYNTDLFKSSTIEGLTNNFVTLLQSLSIDSSQSIQQVPILEASEQMELIGAGLNNFQIPYPREKTVHELFEIKAKEKAEAVALIYGQQILSYEALNVKANQLARYLKTLGVKPEMPIGIYLERGIDSIIAQLAILKAGACYVPLNPEDPAARIRFIVQDTELEIIITDSKTSQLLPAKLNNVAPELVCLDRSQAIIMAQEED
ncbi:MAG: aminotransferase class III-fold pyridoxal phosphate-dependent enzyme [Moorea sp. SIO3I7]|uniref:aminotransferase class III-fold pyridoxal phosphate-dependent enzyme n=1 Tax=unclassified Moorena TaxID=2683338 RepID=UPI0013C11712|nr:MULTISPECIES: aminotransferase class III-fold pyridoxal phosphate-dependent enzyme [unclassified Moorena]NEN94404.1 aminotransferase class III-fold pyridoxal phosphate-dependent enzyme [Moorena sp. SIO3I7]NEO04109.1 aminotransferase class III-fold pyridoxal phosphate-dependent enzyme [Moorena sp. SIO3I8]NEO21819.1 aminotransferase class III-fold pyridoxal phosphate-dependent enzyme [Moorena sp. SIO4A5]NEQ55973.1 aminotransferase class III-fold pyridoxal phosphate-dependent enzyme [Moorena sp